jgi:hypothetical protein
MVLLFIPIKNNCSLATMWTTQLRIQPAVAGAISAALDVPCFYQAALLATGNLRAVRLGTGPDVEVEVGNGIRLPSS